MKILVLSDSHGNIRNMVQAVDIQQPDMIFHLGDVMRDARQLRALYPHIPMEQVPGNCDYNDSIPQEKLLIVEGKRILMCHGHTYGVKSSLLNAAYGAESQQADIFLFGHTHRIFSETRNGIAMLNPGSIGDFMHPSYGIIKIENGSIYINTYNIEVCSR